LGTAFSAAGRVTRAAPRDNRSGSARSRIVGVWILHVTVWCKDFRWEAIDFWSTTPAGCSARGRPPFLASSRGSLIGSEAARRAGGRDWRSSAGAGFSAASLRPAEPACEKSRHIWACTTLPTWAGARRAKTVECRGLASPADQSFRPSISRQSRDRAPVTTRWTRASSGQLRFRVHMASRPAARTAIASGDLSVRPP
jgi:hypothetical protein